MAMAPFSLSLGAVGTVSYKLHKCLFTGLHLIVNLLDHDETYMPADATTAIPCCCAMLEN
eukprot:scaffold230291_cov35-Tisochrysis_lutea.AAC.1